jgi:hypothetical protein
MAIDKATVQTEGRLSRPSVPGRRSSSEEVGGKLTLYAAAALSLVAAMIHLWVTPEHLAHWWGYGAFFLICALAQGLGGVFLLRWPTQPLLLVGIVGNLAIVVLYVISRTWGMPIGPDLVVFSPAAAHLEDPELLGMTATAAEVALVMLLTMGLKGAYRRWMMNFLLLSGATLWVLRFMGVLP